MQSDSKLVELWNRLTPIQQQVVTLVEQGVAPADAYRLSATESLNARSIASMVWKLLNSANVIEYRSHLAGKKVSAMVMTREEMRLRLTKLARANVTDIARVTKEVIGYTDEGEPIYVNRVEIEDFEDVPPETLEGVSEVAQKKDGISIKMRDGIAALKLLAELEGYTGAKTDVKVIAPNGASVVINATDPAEAAAKYQELMG